MVVLPYGSVYLYLLDFYLWILRLVVNVWFYQQGSALESVAKLPLIKLTKYFVPLPTNATPQFL